MKRKHLLLFPLFLCLSSCVPSYTPSDKSLKLTSFPSKVTYEVGEAFSLEGLKVVDSSTQVEILDYTSSILEGYIFIKSDVSNSKMVTISKDGYKGVSYNISVKGKHVPPGPSGESRDLKIYYVNDTHGSFIRSDENKEAGISYISKYIKDKVALDPDNTLVLSGGDMFQGGYESNETRGKIMIEAMNEIGFDAMILGNHEFDWGESYIETFDQYLDCPILSSNTFYSYDNETRPSWLSPYTVIEKDGLSIGIIGADEEGLGTSITGSISDAFYFPEANEYIKEFSTYLRKEAGCDVIIAGFHDGGFEGSSGSPTKFNDLTEVDPETGLKYVDAMFFAHDHLYKSGSYNGVPYLEAGCNGKYIGEMTLSLSYKDDSYVVNDYEYDVINAYYSAKESDPAIDAIAAKEEYKEIIKHADDVIYSFNYSYSKSEFTYVVCQAMYWYVNTHKEEFDNTTIYFASHNIGGIRANVSRGDFTRRDLVKVFPFDNQLSIQTCTTQNISNMEESSYYRTYKTGEPIYVGGLTKAVSIVYITESIYAEYYQQSYVNYPTTAKEALVNYLISNINPNL